jgi:hypothetical protein
VHCSAIRTRSAARMVVSTSAVHVLGRSLYTVGVAPHPDYIQTTILVQCFTIPDEQTACVQMPESCLDSKRSFTADIPAEVENPSTQPYYCHRACTIPWENCVAACGGGSFCEVKCNCELFKDPNSLCRKDGGEQSTCLLVSSADRN